MPTPTIDDFVVVFIAGHGVHDSTPQAPDYFITFDTDVARLSETAAPFGQVKSLLFATVAREKLLLMDTCESGEAEERGESIRGARGGGVAPAPAGGGFALGAWHSQIDEWARRRTAAAKALSA